jgi:hypothetical protein
MFGNGFKVIVNEFDVAGDPVKQGIAFDVRMQVTISPLFGVVAVNVAELVPTFEPFTCH